MKFHIKFTKSQKDALLIAILFLIVTVASHAQTVSIGTAPVLVPAGGFGIDGDLQANTPTAGIGDWLAGPAGSGGYVLDSAGHPLNPGTTFHLIDPYGSNDNTFTGGDKADANPNSWTWSLGSANSKTDINNVLIHFSTDNKGHQWVIVAADRLSNSGEAYMDFEFLQNTLTVNANGTFTSAGPNGGRTAGDFDLTFSTGGNFTLETWQGSGSSYDYVTYAAPAGSVYGANNTTAVPVSFGAFGSTTYAAGTFTEGAVDITALLGSVNACTDLGIKTILVKSKESASVSASLADFVSPIQVKLQLGVAQAGPNQAQCSQGASTTFTLAGGAIASPGDTVKTTTWKVSSGSATITNPSSLTSTVQVTSATATLVLTITTKGGCTAADSLVLTVNQGPTASIGSASSVCSGSPITLTSSTSASNPIYSWSPGGATTSSITVSPTSNTTYSITITDGTSLCSATSVGQTITVSSNPVVNISANGPTTFCVGSSVTLSANGASGYLWNTGATTSFITVSASGSYSVIGTSVGGCSAASSAPVTISVNGNVAVSVSPLSLCEGQTGAVCASATGSSLQYKWNNGITSSCLTVSVPGTYSVLVTNENGCTGTSTVSVNGTNAPNLTVTASGSTTFCNGGSITLTASGAGSYVWNTGSTAASIIVTTQGLYTVTGSNTSGCQISKLTYVTVNPSPPVAITPSGSTTFCNGGSVTLYAGGAGTYLWSNGNNGVSINVNAAGTYSVVGTDGSGCTASANAAVIVNPLPNVTLGNLGTACLNAGDFDLSQGSPAGGTYSGPGVSANAFNPLTAGGIGSYLITYSYTNGNGCSNSASSSITVNNIPDNPGNISGPATAVCANTTQSYSIVAVSGANSYSWTAPGNASVSSGQGTDAISVIFGSSFTSGSLSVVANNGCGSSDASLATISSVPPVPGIIYGDPTPCKKEYNVYWIDPVPGAASYNWNVPPGSKIIGGQGTDTIEVNTGEKSGNITVMAVNACGNSGVESSFAVDVSCRIADSVLLATAGANSFAMVAYPNPAHDLLNILFTSSNDNDYTLRMFDITGRLVINKTLPVETGDNLIQINLNFAKGLYILTLTSGDQVRQSKKIIIE